MTTPTSADAAAEQKALSAIATATAWAAAGTLIMKAREHWFTAEK